jgi:predicted nucleic acid-binding protein
VGSEKNNDHNYRAALIRQAADNTFSVVMVSKREVMVTSLLNEHAKRIASDGANAAPAAPTVDDATARHTAIVNNVLN